MDGAFMWHEWSIGGLEKEILETTCRNLEKAEMKPS